MRPAKKPLGKNRSNAGRRRLFKAFGNAFGTYFYALHSFQDFALRITKAGSIVRFVKEKFFATVSRELLHAAN
jgi:hypothetical protein